MTARPIAGALGVSQSTDVWTAADQAELDVLLHALTDGYQEHRKKCIACDGSPCPHYEAWKSHKANCRHCIGWDRAPLSHERQPFWLQLRHGWLEHNRHDCVRCLPCPHLRRAIAEVLEWREARILLSRAQALRAERAA